MTANNVAFARPDAKPAIDADPAISSLEKYLKEHNLSRVLAAHLRARIKEGAQPERIRAANQLGDLYVEELRKVTDPKERQVIETQARELLKFVPESESYPLRLDLAVATYLKAEDTGERDRLRLARAEDKAEAERVLRSVGPTFEDIASKANKKAETLDRLSAGVRDDEVAALKAEIQIAYSLRSKARYYAGWTAYYLAFLTNSPQKAANAMDDFGWILNASPGRPATLDRLPRQYLGEDHVARAVVGCALCLSLRGNDTEAIRWLDEIEMSDIASASVKEQLFSRRMIILAAANRWAEIAVLVDRRMRKAGEGEAAKLTTPESRLLAVLALEYIQKNTTGSVRETAEHLAQIAFAELIARSEGGQLLDLVSRYGTTLIGDDGFLAQYVRARRSYERARGLHQATGSNPDEPVADPASVNEYQQAAHLFGLAAASKDASTFAVELPRLHLMQGFSHFYARDFEPASEQFQRAFDAFTSPEQKRDALWYGIVALDRAVDAGKVSLAETRDKIAIVYLQNFPNSENAVKLLLRQAQAELLTDEQQLNILLGVKKGTPLYDAARRQSARLLYRAFRKAQPTERPFAVTRFADVAEEVISAARAQAMAGADKVAQDAAQSTILYGRQIADVLLSVPMPDYARVEAALDTIDQVAEVHHLDVGNLASEVAYRRLQIAIAKNDQPMIDKASAILRQRGGDFSLAGDRILYNRAVAARQLNTADAATARLVVRHGLVILDNGKMLDASTLANVRSSVADAAATVWKVQHDEILRDKAVELDRLSMKDGLPSAVMLHRYAELTEAKGEVKESLAAWRELLAGVPESSEKWYEARFHSLRVLLIVDAQAALDAMKQYELLHPDYGPEPWGPQLRDLAMKIRVAPLSPTPTSAPSPQPSAPPADKGAGDK